MKILLSQKGTIQIFMYKSGGRIRYKLEDTLNRNRFDPFYKKYTPKEYKKKEVIIKTKTDNRTEYERTIDIFKNLGLIRD